MSNLKNQLMDRAAGAVDLLIDFATLGEYGLEPVTAPSGGACEGAAGTSEPGAWEALGRARRGDCRNGGRYDTGIYAALR